MTAGTLHSKANSGITTGTNTAKHQYPNPLTTAISSHNSPKASLVEAKTSKETKRALPRKEPVKKKDIIKNEVSQKSKE